MVNTKAKVVIYSAVWCAFCHAAKRYFDSKKITYEEIDVDKNPEAREAIAAKTGMHGVPIIEIGDETIIGFDRPRIDSALAANKLA